MTGPQTSREYIEAMAGLRRTIEQREADRAAHGAARVKPKDLASFDAHGFARALRPHLEAEGLGYRDIALAVGITTPDLTRIMTAQPVSAAKILALCDWSGLAERDFYKPPKRQTKSKMFHVATTETAQKPLKQRGRA